MLENLLQSMAEITVSISCVIAVLLCLTPIIGRRYTAKWRYWVWMILALRLVLPFNFSLPQAAVTVPTLQREIIFAVDADKLPNLVPPQNPVQAGSGTATFAQLEQYNLAVRQYEATLQAARKQAGKSVTLLELLGGLWLVGAAGVLLWQGGAYLHFSRKIKRWWSPPHNPQVERLFADVCAALGIAGRARLMICRKAITPMAVGVFAPVVLLPTERMEEESLSFILRHELVHLKRRDILYKQLLLLACAVHWFNPLVWLMAREANRDVEISCDDAVVRYMNREQRGRYAEVILACLRRSVGMAPAFTTQFSGGKKAMKKRFKNLFDTRKKRSGMAALCVVLVVAMAASGLVACTAKPDASTAEPGAVTSDADPAGYAALDDADKEALGHYALEFALYHASPFATTAELDQEGLGWFALMQLANTPGAEYAIDNGWLEIPADKLAEYVAQRFGIADFTRATEYDAQKKVNRFYNAYDAPMREARYIKTEQSDGEIRVTVDFYEAQTDGANRDAPFQTLLYRFALEQDTTNKPYLRVISAEPLAAEAPQDKADALYTDILLTYGAAFTDYPESGRKLQPHRGASLYYGGDWDAQTPLDANSYFSWYMGYIWQEDLTDEQRAEKYKSPFGEGTGWFFPQEQYEPNIQRYFDVSTELLRSGPYLPEQEGYYLEGGGGLGDLPEILLYKAEPQGDRLDLYLTLRYGDYEYTGRPNDYKILSVRLLPEGGYRYTGYVTDKAPAPEQAKAAERDNTAVSTNTDNVYVNDALGITLGLPANWKNNYTATAQESGYAQAEGTGWGIKLSYKEGNNNAVLGYVFVVPVELWEEVRVTSSSFDVELGRNSRYVFAADMWKNPFAQGADYDLFDQMSFPAQEMVAMATVTEPK